MVVESRMASDINPSGSQTYCLASLRCTIGILLAFQSSATAWKVNRREKNNITVALFMCAKIAKRLKAKKTTIKKTFASPQFSPCKILNLPSATKHHSDDCRPSWVREVHFVDINNYSPCLMILSPDFPWGLSFPV